MGLGVGGWNTRPKDPQLDEPCDAHCPEPAPEIKLHVKGALNNGVTVEEIKAALLHATAYCGIPAGLDAFRAAHEVLVSEGALSKP